MKEVRVRNHRRRAHRRVGSFDNADIYRSPTVRELGVNPEQTQLIDIESLEGGDSSVFVIRDADGETAAILVGGTSGNLGWIHETESFEPGYGRRIVLTFERWAKRRGAKSISLKSKGTAYGFWVKMGYQPMSEPTRYGEVEMVKYL